MFPWSLCSRAARAVKNGLRRFAQWSRLRRALVVAAVLATIFGVLWAITPEVAASIGTGALVVGAAILIPAACALLLLLVGKLLGRLGRLVAAVLGPPLRALARALVHAVGRVGRGCTIAFRRVVHSVAVLRARLRSSGVRRDTSEHGGATPSPAPLTLPFSIAVYQNEYLPRGGTEVHAILEITAQRSSATNGDSPEAAQVILLDCSGSMGHPWGKVRAARHATEVAVDALRDDTWFAVVRGSHDAQPVYPIGGGVAKASAATRAEARKALRLVWPEGGTAMGRCSSTRASCSRHARTRSRTRSC
jgi:hypothetical protein